MGLKEMCVCVWHRSISVKKNMLWSTNHGLLMRAVLHVFDMHFSLAAVFRCEAVLKVSTRKRLEKGYIHIFPASLLQFTKALRLSEGLTLAK